MDCIDCHNRPTHNYLDPGPAIDLMLERGFIATDLPFVKREGMQAIQGDYASHDEARRRIAEHLESFYRREYAALADEAREELTKSREQVETRWAEVGAELQRKKVDQAHKAVEVAAKKTGSRNASAEDFEAAAVAVKALEDALQDGSEFDSSRKRSAPFSYEFGSGQVIAGWEEGIAGMRVGGVRRLLIPPHKGYGSRAVGKIPADSILDFEIELLSAQ